MHVYFTRSLLVIFTLALSFVLNVDDAKASDIENSQKIIEKIESKIRFVDSYTVAESPIDGFYKINFDRNGDKYEFIDKDITKFGKGPSWLKITGRNAVAKIISKDEIFDIRRDVLQRIKKDYLIGPYGNGSRVVIVYTAPECPFCRSFDESMLTIAKKYDITFYIMPTSIRGNSDAYLASVWCSTNPEKAWRESMRNRRTGSARHCEKSKSIMSIRDMFFEDFDSKTVKMISVPGFIFDDGTVKTGFSSDSISETFQSR